MVTQRGRRDEAGSPGRPPRRSRRDTPDADNAPTAEIPAVPADGNGRTGDAPEAVRAKQIPEAAVARLAVYLRVLSGMSEQGATTVSSEELSQAAGVNSAKLRKDLSYLGSYGTRGVGYDVEYLRYQIAREIGVTQDWAVVIVGIGNLGHALANYSGFGTRGFRIVALLDADPDLIGERIGDMEVRDFAQIEDIVKADRVSIGVITTPAGPAQEVCDRLVAAGVTSILNFAPVVLSVPDGVDIRKVDLSIELQILAYHEQRKSGEAALPQVPELPAMNGLPDLPSVGGGVGA